MAEQASYSYLETHYRQTLDDPLPYFDGKTPRVRVISWLKNLENTEARRAAGQERQPYDFQWMWRELKVDDGRR